MDTNKKPNMITNTFTKNNKKRNTIITIIIVPILLIAAMILLFVLTVEVTTNTNDKKSDQTYDETNSSLSNLTMSEDYKLLSKEVKKNQYADNFSGGYSTNWEVAYQNLSSKTPYDVTEDIEEALDELGCVINVPNSYDSYNKQYIDRGLIMGRVPTSQRKIEIIAGPNNQKQIEESSEEVMPKPIICSQNPKVSYFFDKTIDTQSDYLDSTRSGSHTGAEANVTGVDYNMIDFSKQKVDKFVLTGTN